ncbi:UDP-Glycosyltransferase/glycogen phosphorylase [Lenzites betulinus]|nr:UDP-Glycosyltransferase/glycogen phosphorylase [Lenzites betulinus]
MSSMRKHIVAYPFQAWGHARPLINLVVRLVKLRPIDVTFLVTNSFFDRALEELRRNLGSDEECHGEHIRILSLGEAHFDRLAELDHAFEVAWKQLISGEAVLCQKTGSQIAPLPSPCAVIVDMFGIEAFHTVKMLSANSVKVYIWCSGLTAAMFHLFGPQEYCGKGNVRVRAEEEARRTGVPFADIILREYVGTKGEVVRVPGMPPMYDYEYYPQPVICHGFRSGMHVYSDLDVLHRMLEACDGMLLYTSETYEAEAVAAMREWFGKTSRGIYVTGPLTRLGEVLKREQPTDDDKFQAFLDATLATSGERSLLYISFGTMFHGEDEVQKLWSVLDVIMDLDIPFIMSSSSSGDIPEAAKERIDSYPKGLISSWTPQQLILEHPVTGWFLTHGGHNSVIESVAAGVPMIFWPFGADQPLSAVHVSDSLQAGYELIEGRSGSNGLKPIYRTGRQPTGTVEALKAEVRDVLGRAFGADGARKRENMQKFSRAVEREWDEGGVARENMSAFVDSL